ncbi:hypothetical protein [Bradyrhizobium sp. AUGA SZCCT0182]|uniref:hypothetical protein n=1 Tax=Bradyrhizobium sp. AUGA SZCCT0182 TaxID=2807667 RepID=UPI001BA46793|nr:hypothetical protein [Bradyrhizobium sp. AUGA SZCCT0182]MBR1236169.1 hypothetical protein [Bradyrhizobium sp. AUGA SZCCT0182]
MGKKVKFNIRDEIQQRASFEFLHRYGFAMACWARVEQSMYHWFALLTGMPDDMSRSIFYSARGFIARAEMLEAAIGTDKKRTQAQISFIKAAAKKARTYSTFRNTVAHGEPRLNAQTDGSLDDGADVIDAHYTLNQGKSLSSTEPPVTIGDLGVAGDNFKKLSRYMIWALPTTSALHAKPPEECLALVLALPSRPHDKSDPTPEGSAPQPDKPHRPDKKAYRAAQAAKKAGEKK